MLSFKKLFSLSLVASCLFASSAFAVSPTNTNSLVGTWNNTNANSNGTVKIVVTKSGSQLKFQSYGSCSPTPCVHTVVNAYPFSSTVSSDVATSFTSYRNSGFKTTQYDAMLESGHGVGSFIRLNQFSTFAAGDTRKNYGTTELFKKQGLIIIPGIFQLQL